MLTAVQADSLSRSIVSFDEAVLRTVEGIVADVKANGESAVAAYVKKHDGVTASSINLTIERAEIERVTEFPDGKVLKALLTAKSNIERFHQMQRQHSFYTANADGMLGQSVIPLDRIAAYVPGGRALLLSSLLMAVIPAVVAGVPDISIITPPQQDGSIREEIIYLANILGVKRIIKAGGAHGIAYAAFGGAHLTPVDKIVGPGNAYVTLAKKTIYGYCAIDMLAGPSEIMIIADDTAQPAVLARDLLGQAEHDERASSILISTSQKLIDAVNKELAVMVPASPRRSIIEVSLAQNGKSVLAASIAEAFKIANRFGPEHLEVIAAIPDTEVIANVRNAGALFIGGHSPEALGDYLIGSNHVLPTYGASRFASALGVYDFYRRVNVIAANRDYLAKVRDAVKTLAEYEGLYEHGASVTERFK
ncbi:MAG: histidinol dehydrogenase [Spirochaetes bacterium]|nr:histidinol dehydrogenase [Spirochaetota bacterium]